MQTSYSGLNSGEVLLFIHGWPDDESLWHSLISVLEKEYFCVTVTLPGFGGMEMDRLVDFPDLVEGLRRVIVEATKDRPEGKITLVGHDWGAYLSYLLEVRYPELVKRMIVLDVGGDVRPTSIIQAVAFMAYQWWLIAAWLVGKIWPSLGNQMSRVFARVVDAPKAKVVQARMNYLYFVFWRAFLFDRKKILLPSRHCPKVPTLFLYGRKKPYMFHTETWVTRLASVPGNEVVEISAGHWLTRDNPQATNDSIYRWLQNKDHCVRIPT